MQGCTLLSKPIHLLFPWTFSIINNIKSVRQHYRSQAAVPAPAAGQLLCSAAERQRRGPRLAMSLADLDDHTCSVAAYPLRNAVGHPRRPAKLETTSNGAERARELGQQGAPGPGAPQMGGGGGGGRRARLNCSLPLSCPPSCLPSCCEPKRAPLRLDPEV